MHLLPRWVSDPIDHAFKTLCARVPWCGRLGIRTKLMLIALAFLSLPILGYQYVGDLKQFLQAGQERALLLTARAIATVLHERNELFNPQIGVPHPLRDKWDLYAHVLPERMNVDGTTADWGDLVLDTQNFAEAAILEGGTEYLPTDVSFEHILGFDDLHLYALFRVKDEALTFRERNQLDVDKNDHLRIYLEDEFGEPLRLVVTTYEGGRMTAYEVKNDWRTPTSGFPRNEVLAWMLPLDDGYNIELRLPLKLTGIERRIAFAVVDVDDTADPTKRTILGTFNPERSSELNRLLIRSPEIERILSGLDRPEGRTWVVDRHGRVRAVTGNLDGNALTGPPRPPQEPALLDPLTRLLTRDADIPANEPVESIVQYENRAMRRALDGSPGSFRRELDKSGAAVLGAAYPILSGKDVLGAVIVEQSESEILALQNAAIGGLVNTSLVIFIIVGMALLWMSTRLTMRIRRLRDEAGAAIDADGRIRASRLHADETAGDELGELSRVISGMLTRLSSYTRYLERMPTTLRHEILNPLNTVNTSLENLEGEIAANEQTEKYVRGMKKGIERLGSIMHSLTEAASLEQGLVPGEEETFDLSELVREYIEHFANAHPEHRFATDLPGQAIYLNGWPEAIAQMLDKLLDNAVDFSTAERPIRIHLNLRVGSVCLDVENEGPQLPEDIRVHLFDSMVSRRMKGGDRPHLGLGLFVVRTVAERHGGQAEASNLPNGVRFRVCLPLELPQKREPELQDLPQIKLEA